MKLRLGIDQLSQAEMSLQRCWVLPADPAAGSAAARGITRASASQKLTVDETLGRPYRSSISILFVDTFGGVAMENEPLQRWLPRVRGTATLVYVAALCLAVAVLVIGFIPGSPVTLGLPTSVLSGLGRVGGVAQGVVVDRGGEVAFKVTDPSLAQRVLFQATTLPGLLLVAEVARRMRSVLRAAQDSDPFTAQTARELTVVAKITAFGGLGVWAVSNVAKWVLSATMLESGTAVKPHESPLGWLAVGLIFAAFGQLIARGVAMRDELDTVI
jgi:Protein of unknown function (DUF2975)